jgi:hypothetical protein
MSANPAINGLLTWRFSRVFPVLNTTQLPKERPEEISHGGTYCA